MAHSPARRGTVSVRLRRVLVRIASHSAVRRLLVVAGLALAGWLLGGAAHASADTVSEVGRVVADAPQTVIAIAPQRTGASQWVGALQRARAPHRTDAPQVIGASQEAGAPEGIGAPRGRSVPRGVGDFGVPSQVSEVRGALTRRPGGLVKGVRTTVREALLPGKDLEWVLPGSKVAADVTWAPRHRAGVSVVASSGASRVAPGSTRAGGGRIGSRAASMKMASVGSQVSQSPSTWPNEADVQWPAGGTTSGGAAGGIFGGHAAEGGGSALGRRSMLGPAPGDVSPAIRTAADEPSFAPD